MKTYSLKVNTPHDDITLKTIMIDNGKVNNLYQSIDESVVHEQYIVKNASTLILHTRVDARVGKDKVIDIYHEVVLKGDSCAAYVDTRGVVDNNNRIIYRSIIKTDNNYKDLKGEEGMRFYMMSLESEIDAMPNLEIARNDIAAKHTLSITRVNAIHRYYMAMHGLDDSEIEELIVEGVLR